MTVTPATLRAWPLPEPVSEKHGRGLVLVVGGSRETPGSVRLAAEAALRAGCGRVRIATVASVAAALGATVPEARVHGLEESPTGGLAPAGVDRIAGLAEEADVVLVGPGLVDPGEAVDLVGGVLPGVRAGWVLDALGTAYLDGGRDLGALAGSGVVTVNPSELARVLGREPDDPAAAAGELAERTGSVVLLGGETKVVRDPSGGTHVVTAGGPGLATAGSGDVQAGLVAGLLARGAVPDQAAVWGAWLHATAGDRLASRAGGVGFLARELAGEVPALLGELAG